MHVMAFSSAAPLHAANPATTQVSTVNGQQLGVNSPSSGTYWLQHPTRTPFFIRFEYCKGCAAVLELTVGLMQAAHKHSQTYCAVFVGSEALCSAQPDWNSISYLWQATCILLGAGPLLTPLSRTYPPARPLCTSLITCCCHDKDK